MPLAHPDFNRIEEGAFEFLETLNNGPDPGGIATACLELAQLRDAEDGTATAEMYADFNPPWRVERDEIDSIEDLAPIVVLDELEPPHDEFDGSADNYVQYWRIEMMIGISALGLTRQDATKRFIDCRSVLVNHFMGSGAYMGLDRTKTGIERAGLTGGSWASSMKGDQWLCSGFLRLRIRLRWQQMAD